MSNVPSVLIVDDNPADSEYAQLMLEETGRFPHIFSAETAEDALSLFTHASASQARYGDAFPPRLILLDINMPAMDGFEFLEAYSKLDHVPNASTSILMVSSSREQHDKYRACRFPAVAGFLSKPLTTDDAVAIADAFGEDIDTPGSRA